MIQGYIQGLGGGSNDDYEYVLEAYTTPGNFNWTAPAGILNSEIDVFMVAGGKLRISKNITDATGSYPVYSAGSGGGTNLIKGLKVTAGQVIAFSVGYGQTSTRTATISKFGSYVTVLDALTGGLDAVVDFTYPSREREAEAGKTGTYLFNDPAYGLIVGSSGGGGGAQYNNVQRKAPARGGIGAGMGYPYVSWSYGLDVFYKAAMSGQNPGCGAGGGSNNNAITAGNGGVWLRYIKKK